MNEIQRERTASQGDKSSLSLQGLHHRQVSLEEGILNEKCVSNLQVKY